MSPATTIAAAEANALPDGWSAGVLASYIERPEYGYTDSASDDTSGTKFLRITDIQDGQVEWATVPYCRCPPNIIAEKRLLPGDVVVARIGATTGKSFYIDATPDAAVFASYLIRLRVKTGELLPRYLYYYMQSAEYWAHIALHKGDRLKGGVNIGVLESLPIVAPPIREQGRIVAALDAVLAAQRGEGVRAAQAVKLGRAAMSDLFLHGLRREASKETKIGQMPLSWSPRTLKELCDIGSGGTPKKSEPRYWQGDIPWASGKDLKSATLHDTIDHLSPEGLRVGSRLAPKGAVFLLVRGMGLAKDLPVASTTQPMAFNQDLKALVSRGEFSGGFLRAAIYAGRARLLHRLARSAHGTMTLNLYDIETFEIACPSDPDEAEQIVEILELIDAKASLHRRKHDALQALLDSLLNELLWGRLPVEELDLSAVGADDLTVESRSVWR